MTLEALKDILTWVLPPLIGAIIGFVTNAIAIKMLFRPLTEKRIFGLKIPLTPGIIPRQRYELANSIGNMVYQKLITYETLHNHMTTSKFREGLQSNIAGLTGDILYKPVSSIEKSKLQLFYDTAERFMNQTLEKLFSSESFRGLLKKIIDSLLATFSEKEVAALVQDTKLKDLLVSYVLPFLTGDRMKTLLTREAGLWIDNRIQENTPLADIIPESIVDELTSVFRSFMPELLESLFAWLRTPEMTHLLETQGRVLLKNILDRFDFVQKIFISMGQYDKSLENQMPRIIKDTLKSLEEGANDPENQRTFIESVKSGLVKWEQNGVADVLPKEDINSKVDSLVSRVFDAIGNENAREYITKSIDSFAEKNREKSLKEMLEADFGLDMESVSEYLYSTLIKWLSREGAVEKLSGQVVSLVVGVLNTMEERSVGTLFNIDEEIKGSIDRFLVDKIYEIMDLKLPELVESFNVKELVVNKINSLKIEDVEKLLLMVIEKHLKWINVFGAFLGGLIGFIQVIVNLLT